MDKWRDQYENKINIDKISSEKLIKLRTTINF